MLEALYNSSADSQNIYPYKFPENNDIILSIEIVEKSGMELECLEQ